MAKVQEKPKTVVDLAIAEGNFKTFVKALKGADLTSTLKGRGPFTVFGPSDDAFNRLSEDTRNSIMKAENLKQLQRVLRHHIFDGRKMEKDVGSMSKIKMMDGSSLPVTKKGNKVQIGEATIQKTDLEAENGVVHVIDRVLMPS